MFKPTDIGPNRTGIATSPIDSKRTIEGAKEAGTVGHLDGHALELERVRWSSEAVPVGSVPPPGSVKGVVKTVMERLEGHKVTVLIDKLGERLAFERTGARLYDALLAKLEAAHVHPGGPTRQQIMKIRDDEIRHYGIVRDALVQLGADPTAVTPAADVIGVAATGFVQVLTDPRSTLTQCLGVILAAEVTDGEGWDLLVALSESMGFDELAAQFRMCLIQEEQHQMQLRAWITSAIIGQAGVEQGYTEEEQTGV